MAARAVARGDLDQVVPAQTRDELGELGQAFNVMARTIREFREAGSAKLLRAQRTAQATIDSFPDPVVVVDPQGGVERTNPAAAALPARHSGQQRRYAALDCAGASEIAPRSGSRRSW